MGHTSPREGHLSLGSGPSGTGSGCSVLRRRESPGHRQARPDARPDARPVAHERDRAPLRPGDTDPRRDICPDASPALVVGSEAIPPYPTHRQQQATAFLLVGGQMRRPPNLPGFRRCSFMPIPEQPDPPEGGFATAEGWKRDRSRLSATAEGWKRDRVLEPPRYLG